MGPSIQIIMVSSGGFIFLYGFYYGVLRRFWWDPLGRGSRSAVLAYACMWILVYDIRLWCPGKPGVLM